jgi:endonuclease/exonuclease/phosphatase family metal-dependent hydrolase
MRLRVLTYNVHSGTDILGRQKVAEQAALLRDAHADLVLLQEVACHAQAQQLATLAGMPHVAFGPTRRSRSGEFGNAMLCRWPLESIDNRIVSGNWRSGEARAVLLATFTHDQQPVHALATHFGFLPGEAAMAAQTVLGILAERQGPLIMGGDLNRPSAAAESHRLLRSALVDCATASARLPEPTFPSARPVLRLDYLYARELVVREIRVVPSTASDHRPLLAELIGTPSAQDGLHETSSA